MGGIVDLWDNSAQWMIWRYMHADAMKDSFCNYMNVIGGHG